MLNAGDVSAQMHFRASRGARRTHRLLPQTIMCCWCVLFVYSPHSNTTIPGAQAPYETGNKEEEEEEDLQPQTTIGREISVAGIGLHSGLQFQATLRPAPAGHGRVFYLPAEHVEGEQRVMQRWHGSAFHSPVALQLSSGLLAMLRPAVAGQGRMFCLPAQDVNGKARHGSSCFSRGFFLLFQAGPGLSGP